MYLKFIRHNQPCGTYCRGTLYSVHFQPNEKGGYNEHLNPVSDAYEIPSGDRFPLPLIYSAGVRRTGGRLRLALGMSDRPSTLHLINRDAREEFIPLLRVLINEWTDVRVEVCDNA